MWVFQSWSKRGAKHPCGSGLINKTMDGARKKNVLAVSAKHAQRVKLGCCCLLSVHRNIMYPVKWTLFGYTTLWFFPLTLLSLGSVPIQMEDCHCFRCCYIDWNNIAGEWLWEICAPVSKQEQGWTTAFLLAIVSETISTMESKVLNMPTKCVIQFASFSSSTP